MFKPVDQDIQEILDRNPSAQGWTFGKKFRSNPEFSLTYRIEVICNLCGHFWIPAISSLKYGNGCPSCSMTAPEMEIKYWLEDQGLSVNTDFIPQCSFEDLPGHIFDFYLPELSLMIEYDGPFHTKPIYGEEALANRQEQDAIKDHWCRSSGITLIRIPHNADLQHLLNAQVLPMILMANLNG